MQNFFQYPFPFYLSGMAIGSVVLLTFYLKNKPLGASGSFDALCALATQNKYLKHFKNDWRVFFALGLLIAGFISFYAQGKWQLTWNIGHIDQFLGVQSTAKMLVFIAGGFLVGFGTRLANGCTSGHAITGISLGGKNSLLATVIFFAIAVVTAHVLYLVLGGL
jgi:uncharacterized membrane protein YedE/YeeE